MCSECLQDVCKGVNCPSADTISGGTIGYIPDTSVHEDKLISVCAYGHDLRDDRKCTGFVLDNNKVVKCPYQKVIDRATSYRRINA